MLVSHLISTGIIISSKNIEMITVIATGGIIMGVPTLKSERRRHEKNEGGLWNFDKCG
jgi:hypothetical protein